MLWVHRKCIHRCACVADSGPSQLHSQQLTGSTLTGQWVQWDPPVIDWGQPSQQLTTQLGPVDPVVSERVN